MNLIDHDKLVQRDIQILADWLAHKQSTLRANRLRHFGRRTQQSQDRPFVVCTCFVPLLPLGDLPLSSGVRISTQPKTTQVDSQMYAFSDPSTGCHKTCHFCHGGLSDLCTRHQSQMQSNCCRTYVEGQSTHLYYISNGSLS